MNYSGRADFGNIHMYLGSGGASVGIVGNDNGILYGICSGYVTNLNPSHFAITETGYHTDNFTNGVTEDAQAILILNTLLNAIVLGIRQTIIYELIDEVWPGYVGQESHFGLFHNNQTTKPAARALRFLSGILSDSAGGDDSLSFSIYGLPVGYQYQLFQKSDSTFILVIWNNSPVYNPVTQTDIATASVQVTMVLPGPTTVSIYDIYDTTASDEEPLHPLSTVTGMSVPFSMSNKAVVMSFAAPATSSTSSILAHGMFHFLVTMQHTFMQKLESFL